MGAPAGPKAKGRLGRSLPSLLLAAPGVLWLVVFSLVPIGFVVAMSFWKSSIFGTTPAFSFENYERALLTPLYRNQLLNTIRISLVTTVLALLVSYPVAFFISRLKGIWKPVFVLMLFMPFWTSYVVRSFVWLPILGRNGIINQGLMAAGIIDQPLDWLIYNEGAVLLGLVYVYVLFMTLPIYLSLERIDVSLLEAASDLGARPAQIFRRVILPLSWSGVLAGSIMVFLLSIGAFVTPQLLGGTSGIMFGNIIASQFLSSNNWAFGAALSVSMMVVVLVFLLIASRWIGLGDVFGGGKAGR